MNSRARAAEVFAELTSNLLLTELAVGSSTSFSGLPKAGLLFIAAGEGDGGRSPARILPRRLPPAFVNAANDPEVPEDTAALREASAVFAEIEAVGGPDTKIDRNGGSNAAEALGSAQPEPAT
jgi:hypothetical protein